MEPVTKYSTKWSFFFLSTLPRETLENARLQKNTLYVPFSQKQTSHILSNFKNKPVFHTRKTFLLETYF